MSGSHKGLGWTGYIQAALKKYAGSLVEADTILLPTPCSDVREYTVRHADLGVELHVVEYRVRRVGGVVFNADRERVAGYLKGLGGEVVLLSHNLFSLGFAYDLLYLLPRLRRMGAVAGVVAYQHAMPPFKYYREAGVSAALKALGPLLERLLRGRVAGLVDGFIVINEKTYMYLTQELGVDPGRVVFQHVGVDYEQVSPMKVVADSGFWAGCEHRLIMSSIVSRTYGGFVKGVDLLPHIVDELERLGYRACVAVAGEVLDPELAALLRERGVRLAGFLPRPRLHSILAAADAYILPARRECYHGGIGVSTIEALALDRPVVSPLLEHVPDKSAVPKLGVQTPWLTGRNVRDFAEAVAQALEGSFQPREHSRPIYDVRVMAARIAKLIKAVAEKQEDEHAKLEHTLNYGNYY